ncbi:hypothetical protein SLE2022_236640 [Rubroshorea leprosula]
MEEQKKKRWSVTYTKHIKQKRKLYQDGFLDLHTSMSKVILYDDCEKLLECRILRKDEDVTSGETLTFNAYLVDVGDPEGDHEDDLNFHKLKNNLNSSELKKANTQKNKVRSSNLTPSQKIIKEFKDSELQKCGAPQISPNGMEPSTTEMQVLYTTQLTQRAKKYHDGFLRLSVCGSMGRKVMLFDESRKLLDSRFLKKDEIVTSGESIVFDAYLVEIGECERNLGEGKNRNNVGVRRGEQNKYESDGILKKEWQVLYTTHVTQKAKKYHEGILRLANYESRGRQIMLYDASKKLLNSRFLKKDEVIRSGESIAFDAHLVDIGEPEGNHHQDLKNSCAQISSCNITGEKTIHRKQNCQTANKLVLNGKLQNYTCPKEYVQLNSTVSNIDDLKLRKSFSANKPLRDAQQILSVLQKPLAKEIVNVSACSNNGGMTQVSSTKKLQDVPEEDCQFQGISTVCYGSREVDIGKSPRLISPEARLISGGSGGQLSKDTDAGNSHQSDSNNLQANTQYLNEAFVFGTSSSIRCPPDPVEDKHNNSEDLKIATEIDKCPSFDLGF